MGHHLVRQLHKNINESLPRQSDPAGLALMQAPDQLPDKVLDPGLQLVPLNVLECAQPLPLFKCLCIMHYLRAGHMQPSEPVAICPRKGKSCQGSALQCIASIPCARKSVYKAWMADLALGVDDLPQRLFVQLLEVVPVNAVWVTRLLVLAQPMSDHLAHKLLEVCVRLVPGLCAVARTEAPCSKSMKPLTIEECLLLHCSNTIINMRVGWPKVDAQLPIASVPRAVGHRESRD